jgi:hypothetical protein
MTHSDQQTYWPPPTCTPSHSHYLLEKIIMTRKMDIHSFLHATTLLTELLLVVWIWISFLTDDRFFLLLPILVLIMV